MSPPRPKRAPSAALLVTLIAAGSAATVAALGFPTAATVVPGIPKGADLVAITNTPYGRPVAPGFVGLSVEYTAIQPWVGSDPHAPDPVLVRLLENLAPGSSSAPGRRSGFGPGGQTRHPSPGNLTGRSASARQTGTIRARNATIRARGTDSLANPVLRIGGNSTDWGWYSPHHRRRPPGIRFTLDRNWVATTRALAKAAHASIIAGLNLKANDPRLLSNEAEAFATLGHDAGTPTAFEIGNEPEKFGSQTFYVTRRGRAVSARSSHYSFRSYAADFDRFSHLVASVNPLAAPTVGRQSWWPPIPAFLAGRPRVKLVTLHVYPLHNCVVHPQGMAAPSIAHLLLPAASRGAATAVAPYVAPAHDHEAQLRVDELNSVSCGGARGVSDTFASALWALDTLFAMAQVGVDGVNIHAFPGAAYAPFAITHRSGRWRAVVTPLYLGLLAFVHAAPPGSTLLRVSNPDHAELRVWAARTARGGHVHVALINTSPTETHTIAIEMPGGPGAPRLERLTAASLKATSDVTLGGQSFGRSTSSGELEGHPLVTKPEEVRPGIYLLRLPAASAALLTR